MITENQKFTDQDLFQSIDELASADIGQYVSTPLMYSFNGTDVFDLRKISPTKYTEIALAAYDIPSSAHHLDKQIKDKGYRTTYKFSYKYNMTPQMRQRITSDAYKLQYFFEIFNHPNLPRNEVVHDKQFEEVILNALRVTYWYAQYIWANNPGVYDYSNLAPDKDWFHILMFVIGAGFEFHPLDIKYHEKVFYNNHCRNQNEYTKQTVFKKWCKRKYDIDTGCLILSPENMEKLRKILLRQDTPYVIQIIKKYLNMAVGSEIQRQ